MSIFLTWVVLVGLIRAEAKAEIKCNTTGQYCLTLAPVTLKDAYDPARGR